MKRYILILTTLLTSLATFAQEQADTVIITKSPPYLCAEEKRAAIAANHIGEGQHIEDKSPEGLYDIK